MEDNVDHDQRATEGSRMEKYMKSWQKNIRNVIPYVPGEQPNQPGMIKLNTNENPYPPAPGVERVLRGMKMDTLRLYPDPTVGKLVEELSGFYRLNSDMVFVGVGSDDVLATAFLTFFNSNKPILFPDITYSFYPVWAKLFDIPYETPALDESFRLKKEDYCRENGGIIIANPNAPTSVYEELDDVEEIIRCNQESVVIIDEAYIDFAGRSAVELISKYDNLLVVQTFSKSRSMAGMRIGYAMGNPVLIKALNDVKYSINSYTMNETSILSGVEAVKDAEYFYSGVKKIIATRARAEKEFESLGFTFPKSGTNFMLVTHKTIPAKDIFLFLREHNIYVRYFNLPRIDNCLRVTIGTDEEMNTLFKTLNKYISK